MDTQRFDSLTRSIATSRRRAVVAIAGALLGVAGDGSGSALAGQGVGSSVRRPNVCRINGSSCTRNQQCCTGTCASSRVSPRRTRNRCGCPAGLTDCRNACVDLTSDLANCGACGHACPGANDVCRGGDCVCIPDCDGMCGDDGCGGTCPPCTNAQHQCLQDGMCAQACDTTDEWCFLSIADVEVRYPNGCTTRKGSMSGACSSDADCLTHADYQSYANTHPSNIEAVCISVIFFRRGYNEAFAEGQCFVKPPVTGTCW